MTRQEQIEHLNSDWQSNNRWTGLTRPYSAEEVVKLRGSMKIEYTIAKKGSEKLWKLINSGRPTTALGALTGNQAIQEIQAGLNAIYCSGWLRC